MNGTKKSRGSVAYRAVVQVCCGLVAMALGACGSHELASVPGPTITSCDPAIGVVGTSVVCSGFYFTNATAVAFNGIAAQFSVIGGDGTQFSTTVPVGATTGPISITTPHGQALSPSFVVIGAPAKLVFVQQPTNAQSGAVIAPAVSVAIEDAAGNTVLNATNAIHMVSSGGALFVPTPTVANGVTTFTGMELAAHVGQYTLTASSDGLTSATSVSFNLSAGAAAQLAFVQQPTNVASGAVFAPAVTVAVQDSGGNVIGSSSPTVQLTGSNGTVSGGAAAASNGIATFNELSFSALIGSYTLVATDPSGLLLPATSASFSVTGAGAPAALQFVQQPESTQSGAPFAQSVTVVLVDAAGNPALAANAQVALSLVSGAGTLANGTASIAAGLATFTGLTVSAPVGNYQLLASSSTYTSATSAAFQILLGAPAQLVFLQQPTSAASGATISPAVTVAVEDSGGNLETGFGDQVNLVLGAAESGVLAGASQHASGGVATFAGLSLTALAGNAYTLVATSDALPITTSASFSITAGVATRLMFLQQPTNTPSGAAITPAVTVAIVDAAGNVVTGATNPVGLATASGRGTLTFNTGSAVAGVATFTGLTLAALAGSYSLVATAQGYPTVASSSFAISTGAASQLVFTQQPSDTPSGGTMSPVTVTVEDSGGNVAASTANITLALKTGTWLVVTDNTQVAVNGVATFNTLAITAVAGNYTLKATATNLTTAFSDQFALSAGVASKLVFKQQPTSATSGAVITPLVTVAAEDAAGNLATTYDNTHTISLTLKTGSGNLTGTLQSPTGGLSTFSQLALTATAGSGFSLIAADLDGALAPATSTTFSISSGVATKVVFTSQPPATVQAGVAMSPAVVVQIEDASGNIVFSNAAVTLAVSPSGTLTNAVVVAGSGVATFSNLSLAALAGSGYTLTATSGALTSAPSSSFAVGVGPATHLAFTTQPSTVGSGALFSPSVVAKVEDAGGNVVATSTALVALTLGGGAGTLANSSMNAASGVAAFSGLTVSAQAASGYTLTAASAGLTSATSTAFNVVIGAATMLVFTTQPSAVGSGAAFSPVVVVKVEDSGSNVVTGSSASVTLSLSSGAGALANASVSAASGVATFTGLTVTALAANDFIFTAASSGLTSAASSAFAVTVGAAAKLVFTSAPSDVASGAAFSPLVAVSVEDTGNNIVSSSTASIALTLGGGTGSLANSSMNAVNGVATFSALTVSALAASGYTLTAASAGLSPMTSGAFSVTVGAATQLAFTTQPTTVGSGVAFSPVVVVKVEDSGNNVVQSSTASVTLSLATGTGTLVNATVTAASGVATFSSLRLTATAAVLGYSFTAASSGVTWATSNAFTVTYGAAAKLVFSSAPTDVGSGALFSPVVVVSVEDSGNNVIGNSTAPIALALGGGSGSGTLANSTMNATNGVATFSTLSVSAPAASGYTLTVTSASLSPSTSSVFSVVIGAATKLVFTTQPSAVGSGVAFSPVVVVKVEDSGNNVVTNSAASVTLSLATGTGTLAGATLSASSGVASFSSLSLTATAAVNGYSFTAASLGLPSITSSPFTVTYGAPAKLVFTSSPSTVGSGAAFSPSVAVSVEDTGNNIVANSTASIALTLGGGSGSGTLANASMNAVNGVATFNASAPNALTVSAPAATGYTLTAASVGVSSATSSAFDVVMGAAAKLVFTTQPASVASGATFTNSVVVKVEDSGGNIVTNSAASVTLTLATGTGTLANAIVGAASGVTTFNALTVTALAASNFSFAAAASGLTSATSNQFAVTYGAAAKLVFTAAPSNVASGALFSPIVVVSVEDSANNVVGNSSAAIAFTLGGGSGSLANASMNAVNGVATFSSLTVSALAASGYTLTAASGGLPSVTSIAFSVSLGAATQLVFTTQPTTVASRAAFSPVVVVKVEDSGNNIVTTSVASIALTLATGSGTLANNSMNAVNGVASFAVLTVSGLAATNLSFNAASAGLTTATSGKFNLTAGAATKMVFTTQPTDVASGALFSPVVVAQVEDADNNVVTGWGTAVTIWFSPGSGQLTNNSVNPVNGVATFTSLTINALAASNFVFHAASSGLTDGVSNAFSVTWGAATHVAITTQPTTVGSGSVFSPAVVASVLDSGGNVVPTWSSPVTLALATGSGALANYILIPVSGVATYSSLTLTAAAMPLGYSFIASTPGLSAAPTSTSNAFTVTYGTATRLVFTAQPTNVASGATFSPSVEVTVEDSFGNVVDSSATITLHNLGSGVGTLANATMHALHGVASFHGLDSLGFNCDVTLTGAAGAYSLTATSNGLATATSAMFSLSYGTATQLVFTSAPTNVGSGALFSPVVTVSVEDSANNVVSNSSAPIVLTLGGGAGPGTLANATMSAVNGVATFSNLTVSARLSNGYTLTATSSPLSPITSVPFKVNVGAATKLVFTTQPTTVGSGLLFSPSVQVSVEDSGNNVVANSSALVTLSLATGTGTLANFSINAGSGVAIFSVLALTATAAVNGYSFTAASAGLTSATSSVFTVTYGSASKLLFTTQPPSSIATLAFTTAVTMEDSAGNVVLTSGTPIALAMANNPGSSTLGGTASVNTTSGVATFSDLYVSNGGIGYTLSATSASLTSATSNPFTVPWVTSGTTDVIASGTNHSCAVVRGGIVCWGVNSAGQLGTNGDSANWTTAHPVVGLGTGVTAVSAGGNQTCAVVNGSAKCWGNNQFGNLGNNSTTNSNVPVQVTGLTSGVQAVAVGVDQTCALVNGGVWCWGYGADDALGNNAAAESNVPVQVFGLSAGVQAIAAGEFHVCALVNGGVKCWGNNGNGDGALGNNSSTNSAVPVQVVGMTSGVSAIAANGLHNCALKNGGVWCWGSNDYGELGNNSAAASWVPVQVSGLTSNATAVFAGAYHSCAIVNGAASCWGLNANGELGNNSTVASTVPVQVSNLSSGVQSMAAGQSNTCALVNGAIQCWGYGAWGGLGNSSLLDSLVPVQTTAVTLGTQGVAVGEGSVCGIINGGAECWGFGTNGNLGNNSTITWSTPVQVYGLTSGVQAVSGGVGQQNCAIVNGGVQCWGYNFYTYLGNNTSNGSYVPVQVTGITAGAQSVSAGWYSTCALVNGGVQCWGKNSAGQLGNNTTVDSLIPVPVTGLTSDVQAVAVGYYSACALKNGGVQCWGLGGQGGLGNNSTANSNVPVQVSGLTSGVQAIAMSKQGTACALVNGGEQCWGRGLSGELGNNTTVSSSIPVSVTGLTNGVELISGGVQQDLAVVNGNVTGWGDDAKGTLGNNSTVASLVPAPSPTLIQTSVGMGGIQALAAGEFNTCVLVNGDIQCWGYGPTGGLGNNTFVTSYAPVLVSIPGQPR